VDEVLVATDDARIAGAVTGAGGSAVETSPACATGSDRVWEAVRDRPCDIVLNLQGDEPALSPAAVGQLVALMRADPSLQMGTLASRLTDPAQHADPNVVKVVLGEGGRCLYFSRSPVPHLRGAALPEAPVFRHVGVYAFRKAFLGAFTAWPQGALERTESLEQLRALERGVSLRAAVVDWAPVAVDVPEDVPRAEAALRALEASNQGIRESGNPG
jgi:3-deoxy-manno-octulosonate cytidylyltransferase (CMP-KDO synthetase)